MRKYVLTRDILVFYISSLSSFMTMPSEDSGPCHNVQISPLPTYRTDLFIDCCSLGISANVKATHIFSRISSRVNRSIFGRKLSTASPTYPLPYNRAVLTFLFHDSYVNYFPYLLVIISSPQGNCSLLTYIK